MIDVRAQDYAYVTRWFPSLHKAFKETGDWVTAAARLDDNDAQLIFGWAARSGLFDATYASDEALKLAARRFEATLAQKLNPLSSHGPLLHGGGMVMQNVEAFHRLAAFVRHFPQDQARELGGDFASRSAAFANDMVNMVHFDYADLTRLEEGIKKFVPFFVWTRRNLPLQMRALVEQPRMIARYNHLIHGFNDQMESRDDIGPRRYGGQSFIGTDMVWGEDTPFWARVILDPDIPVKDLFELENPLSPQSYLNLAIGMLSPHIQQPLQLAEQDSYKVNAPVGFQWATRAVNSALRGADWNAPARMDSRVSALLRTLLPPASEYLTAFEDDARRKQRLGIVDDDLWSRIRAGLIDATLPGLGYQTQSVADQEALFAQSAYSYSGFVSELRKSGVLTPELEATLSR
jgi:hypothetical protein